MTHCKDLYVEVLSLTLHYPSNHGSGKDTADESPFLYKMMMH